MLYYNVDPRDGGPSGASCQTCCCQSMALRPGETNMVTLNYAGWSLPMTPPGLIPSFEYFVDHNDSMCPSGDVGGFPYPANNNYYFTTLADTPVDIDLSTYKAPVANSFSYRILPFSGPKNGFLSPVGVAGGPTFSYTPNGGFTGYDYFAYEMTDAQGRPVIRMVRVSVGSHNARPNAAFMSLLPYIDRVKVATSQRHQTITFPIYMPLSCRPCDRYRLTIKQGASSCNNVDFSHQSCFDIVCKDCG